MIRFFIHYRASDGEIIGWGSGYDPQPVPGYAIALFDQPLEPPAPLLQRFDAAANAVVEKTVSEKYQSALPTLVEVQGAIAMELRGTDHLMLPDYPHTGSARHAWTVYRQMLRGLSSLAGPVEMINAWTPAPNGFDPITALRERLTP